MKRIDNLINDLIKEIENIENLDERVSAINKVRTALHGQSPFRNEPADCVIWVKQEQVYANEWNPNKVASPEMRLLHTSIKEDGYTMPIVASYMKNGEYKVVDGFHRNRVGKEYKDIKKRIHGYLPLSILAKPTTEEFEASTIRHNRARGTHQIRSMSDIVLDLTNAGWTDVEICDRIGMELDEVIRLKQITGLKEAFQNHDFSKSWEEFEKNYYEK